MKTCSLLIILCVYFQYSGAYSKTAFMLELNIFILVPLPMIWLPQFIHGPENCSGFSKSSLYILFTASNGT